MDKLNHFPSRRNVEILKFNFVHEQNHFLTQQNDFMT